METVVQGNTVLGSELDYAKYSASHGSYQLTKIIQQSGSQTIFGGLTTSGGQETIFELPPKVYNFSQSLVEFTITPDAGGAGNYNFVFNDTVAEIRQIQLYTRSGLYMCDIQDANNYLNLVLRSHTRLDELITNDNLLVWQGLQTCSVNISDPGGADVSINNTIIPSLSTTTIDKITTANYYLSGNLNGPTPVYTRQFPLSIFKNTILAMNKDLYFGGETLYLRFVWAPLNKIMYVGTSVDNLSTGAGAAASPATVTNLTLYAAVEQNQVIQEELMSKVNSGSFSILIPYVFENKLNLQGTTQTVNVRYNKAHGRRLKKIILAPYNGTEGNQTAYDHENVASSKVTSFYTTVNNVRTTQFNPTAANYDEWLLLQKKLRGSCIQSATDYYSNYFWIEDFTNNLPVMEKPSTPAEDNQSDGISLDQELIYSFYANTMNATYNWYVFAVTERLLSIAPAGAISLN